MRANGTGRRRLKRSPPCFSDAAWSPDGTRIVFVDLCGEPTFPVYVTNSDGSAARQIAVGDNPTWSPDGTMIALDSPGVRVMRADGSEPRVVVAGSSPSWSPDGQRIAFTRETTSVCAPDQRVTQVLSVSVDGSGEREITPRRSSSTCEFQDSRPDWQPRCTRYGSNRNNRVTGTAGRDVICALAGRDIIRSGQGDDVVVGGGGNDLIYGGPGKDWLFGSAGNDLIMARDGSPDIVSGGPGRDRARIDRGLDKAFDVERVLR
jgi:hypothetical protein